MLHFLAPLILLVCNPFIYERLLAGQWQVVLGSILLFPLFYCCFSVIRFGARDIFLRSIFVSIFFIGLVSPHFYAIAIVFICMWVAFCLIISSDTFSKLEPSKLLQNLLFFFFASLYWILPTIFAYARSSISVSKAFALGDWYAYAPTLNSDWGAVGTMMSGYGIWAQRYAWSKQWLWPPIEQGVWWYFAVLVLLIVIILGFCALFLARREGSASNTEDKNAALFLLSSGILSIIFALGVSETSVESFNVFLANNIPFWLGFRDTHKWIGVLMAIYVYLYAEGGQILLSRAKSLFARVCIYILLVVAPLAYSPYVISISLQIRPTDYPKTWYEIDALLSEKTNCNAIFLPWHQYYYLGMNNYILTGNLAPTFFHCNIYSSQDAEHGAIGLPSTLTSREVLIHSVMTDKNQDAEAAAGLLQSLGINSIIVTEIGTEYEKMYWILNAKNLRKVYERQGVALYEFHK
jgi:hypothetical protein